MQVALDDENVSPLDATLESVMPGVHQRFVALEGHVKTLNRGVTSSFDQLKTMVQDGFQAGFTALHEYNRERDSQLAARLHTMAEGLALPSPSIGAGAPFPPRRRQQQQQESPSPAGDVTPPSPGPRHHRMVLKHHSIESLWNEWYGLGEFEGKPVVGGIDAIERHDKSKWRKHFSMSEKKHFSRSQIVIRGINATIHDRGETFETTMESFEVTYEAEAKFSMAKMAAIVQTLGLVARKKSRGKTKQAD
jgi:hypothetical protein